MKDKRGIEREVLTPEDDPAEWANVRTWWRGRFASWRMCEIWLWEYARVAVDMRIKIDWRSRYYYYVPDLELAWKKYQDGLARLQRDWMTTMEVAAALGVSKRDTALAWLYRMGVTRRTGVARGVGVRGGAVYWLRKEVMARLPDRARVDLDERGEVPAGYCTHEQARAIVGTSEGYFNHLLARHAIRRRSVLWVQGGKHSARVVYLLEDVERLARARRDGHAQLVERLERQARARAARDTD